MKTGGDWYIPLKRGGVMETEKHCEDCQHYLDRTAEPGDGLCREDIVKEKSHYTILKATKAQTVSCDRFNQKVE